MIFEIQLSISTLHLPQILHLPLRDVILQSILAPDVDHLPGNQALTQAQRAQRTRIPKLIWRIAVDLPGDDSGRVAHGLLKANGSRTPIMRCNVDVEPGQVDAWTDIDGYSAQIGGKVSHA